MDFSSISNSFPLYLSFLIDRFMLIREYCQGINSMLENVEFILLSFCSDKNAGPYLLLAVDSNPANIQAIFTQRSKLFSNIVMHHDFEIRAVQMRAFRGMQASRRFMGEAHSRHAPGRHGSEVGCNSVHSFPGKFFRTCRAARSPFEQILCGR